MVIMKLLFYLLPFFLTASVLCLETDNRHSGDQFSVPCFEHIRIDVENDILVLSCEYNDNLSVEITQGDELYINGKQIKLNTSQRRLVEKYYENFMDLIDQAKALGMEGARIGFEGAKIGLIATRGLIKMAFCDYDAEQLENEIKDATDNLKDESEELQELTDELQNAAEDLQELHLSLKRKIIELNQLTWF